MKAPATIMVAPNGARRMRDQHAALPVTIAEIAACARDCLHAGADAIHAHVRDRNGAHVLDAGLYRELLAEIAVAAPGLAVQVTTEAVGRYSAGEQIALVRALQPAAVSCALRELVADQSDAGAAGRFYREAHDAGIGLQHILYTPDEVASLADLVRRGVVPAERLSVLFVVGSYQSGDAARAPALLPFLDAMQRTSLDCRWMVCGFGAGETEILAAALALGGHARVGFENSLHRADGSLARDNAERVADIATLRAQLGLAAPDGKIRAASLGSQT